MKKPTKRGKKRKTGTTNGKSFEIVKVPVEWNIPDDIITRYATNLVVQHTDQEFTLSFFETRQPILLGTPEESLATVKKLKTMRADCIARIVVTPEKMSQFVEVMGRNVARHLKTMGKENE